MSDYITAKEAALNWGVTSTWVTVLCKSGRIIDAKKENGKWIIPINTPKPNDSRKKHTPDAKFRFIDLFAGIGGFHQAMRYLGGECVMAAEINQACVETYKNNFSTYEGDIRGDVTQIDPLEIEQFDVLCAGFPCQPFSKAGQQKGFSDEKRGNLFYTIMDFLDSHPEVQFVILENVRNLADKTENWEIIRTELLKRDFIITKDALILSPSDFGLPQIRERVYILGVKRDGCNKRIQKQGYITKEDLNMRILMLGNSFTFANDMPSMLAELTGAEVVHHTRGGARLAEQLNPKTKTGAKMQAALENEFWDYVVLQEMSNGPVTSRNSFLKNVGRLCAWIKEEGASPLLFATWAYQKDSQAMAEMDMSYDEMAQGLHDAYREAANQNDVLIAEVGQKFYELADSQELYSEDGQHPSEAGSRLAAETIAAVIKADQEEKKAATTIEVDPNLNWNDIRLRVLYMYQLLLQHTDAEHQLTTNQIRNIMEKEHGITMHRTTVPGDIEMLKAAGFDVHARRSRQNKYYLENSNFELPELKILIDAVESSKFITEKKSRLLVEKLLKLTSETSAAKLKRNLHTSGRVRSANEKGYYIVDAINEAINSGKQISFFYTDFDGRKKQILRNDGKPYIVSPYTLIWNGDYYYLVGWNHEQEETRTYRVDRILKTPDILQDDAQSVPEDFDVARYTREVFRMYDNEEPEEVTLLCANEVMKGVLDKFGMDITVKKADPEHFRTKVKVCTSPTFYSWVFQWGGKVRIEGPEAAVTEYRKMAQKALEGE